MIWQVMSLPCGIPGIGGPKGPTVWICGSPPVPATFPFPPLQGEGVPASNLGKGLHLGKALSWLETQGVGAQRGRPPAGAVRRAWVRVRRLPGSSLTSNGSVCSRASPPHRVSSVLGRATSQLPRLSQGTRKLESQPPQRGLVLPQVTLASGCDRVSEGRERGCATHARVLGRRGALIQARVTPGHGLGRPVSSRYSSRKTLTPWAGLLHGRHLTAFSVVIPSPHR